MVVMQQRNAQYAMGYSDKERQRLIEQGAVLRPWTKQLLEEAGIGPGMRVLDLGCGVGGVSLLAAELVGPAGRVVGVDVDPLALRTAGICAAEAGMVNVNFVQGDLHDVIFDESFDAAVGRLVLLHLRDPVTGLRRIADHVRPGGIVAFQELDFTRIPRCFPSLPLWERWMTAVRETFRRAGLETSIGFKLPEVFQAAGLPAPRLRLDAAIGAGPDSPLYQILANTVRSLLPLMEKLGVTTAAEAGIETLAARFRDEAVSLGGTVTSPPHVGAWTRTPVD